MGLMELGGTIKHKQMVQALMHKILTPRFIDYINVSIIDMEWLHCNTGEDGLFFPSPYIWSMVVWYSQIKQGR